MFPALFTIVYTVIVLLVQSIDSIELNNVKNIHSPHMEIPLRNAFLQSKRHSIGNFVSNKNDVYNRGLLMDSLEKKQHKRDVDILSTVDPTLYQLKQALSKILVTRDKVVKKRDLNILAGQRIQDISKLKRNEGNAKWNKWTEWSSCSVTCGKGREIRWRHCRNNCNGIETEMEEKACQLPSCPRKLFGIIKL